MTRIQLLFKEKKEKILSVYFTAGYPLLDSTEEIIRELTNGRVDMLEIGMPFSDPVADGPVIQHSNAVALANGMSLKLLFRQLKMVREYTSIPLVLMGYLNPILQYGFHKFCKEAANCGVDGLIIPDLPIKEYKDHYKMIVDEHKLNMIFLITPTTAPERITAIDELSEGFIYLVTAAAITGTPVKNDQDNEAYFKMIQKMSLRNPLMAGFGIAGKQDFEKVTQYTTGAIVGSSFINTLNRYVHDIQSGVSEFLSVFR